MIDGWRGSISNAIVSAGKTCKNLPSPADGSIYLKSFGFSPNALITSINMLKQYDAVSTGVKNWSFSFVE